MNEPINERNENKIHNHHIIVTVIVIIVLGLIIFMNKSQVKAPEPVVNESVIVDTSWPSSEIKKESIEEKTDQYSITAVYPVVKDTNISLQFKQFTQNQIDQFKSDTSWATDPSIAPAEASELSIDINYTEKQSKFADNYIFNITTYTGGAHGLQVTKTFSYNSVGRLLSVSDLFSNNTKGLNLVADAVQKELISRDIGDASWISDGAAPTADNYQNFTIGDDDVTFMFDPYQVAPYAAGPQSVTVPITVFQSVKNPDLFTQ